MVFFSVAFVLGIVTCVSGHCHEKKCATLYENANAHGYWIDVTSGDEVTDMKHKDNKVSSFRVMKGCRINLYCYKGFHQKMGTYGSGDRTLAYNLINSYNDCLSSYSCYCEGHVKYHHGRRMLDGGEDLHNNLGLNTDALSGPLHALEDEIAADEARETLSGPLHALEDEIAADEAREIQLLREKILQDIEASEELLHILEDRYPSAGYRSVEGAAEYARDLQ